MLFPSAAVLSLAGASYVNDAGAPFEWLVKNAKDAMRIEIARRELAKLRR